MFTVSNDKIIHIKMLGGFSITKGQKVISDEIGRTKQVWNLLEYLLANRTQDISQEKLIEILWPNDNSDNPANALKNLIYRLRNLLSELDEKQPQQYIVFKRGAYSWNNELDSVLDIEMFESMCKHVNDPDMSSDQKIKILINALELYGGDFLPKSAFEEWVIPRSAYYHRLYIDSVCRLIELYNANKQYDDIVLVAEKAISIDPYEELLHKMLIRALIDSGKQSKALSHYEYVTNLFYKELGLRPSEGLRELYREIIKNVNSIETDLEVIKEDLKESNNVNGAFYCEYEVFKHLYRLEARSAARTGQSVYVALLTVTDEANMVPSMPVLNNAMDTLKDMTIQCLRKGDVISRFSGTQYVLMLPTLTFENGEKVLKRIVNKFGKVYKGEPVHVHLKLQPLDPVELL